MTTFGQSLKSVTIQGLGILVKLRFVLIGMLTVGLGILFGSLINSLETGWVVLSIVVQSIVLTLTINKPLNGMLLLLFFMQFVETWINIPLGAGIPDLTFSRFLVAFLAIFMLAMAAIGKFRFARIGLADICILATTIGIMVTAPQSVNPTPKGVIQMTITQHFTPLVMYFFAKNLVKDEKDLHKVLWTIALLGFVSGAYVPYENATGNVLFVARDKEVGSLLRSYSGIQMVRGIWGSSGNMGRALVAAIPVTFYLLLERKGMGVRRILLAGMLVAQFAGLLLAMVRAPWYSLLLALFIMQFFYPQFRKVFFVIAFVAAIFLWATWDQVLESDAANRVNDKVSTLEGRKARWQAGYNMWRAKPIRGWGFGRYERESGRFRTDGERRNSTAIENDYLHILVGSGLIGFLPYLIFLLVPLVNSLRLFFRARAPDWPGFIKPETITIYWANILCLAITSYSATQTQSGIKLMTFVVAGAVVGTHEHWLHGSKTSED